jgi:hypothetical protein
MTEERKNHDKLAIATPWAKQWFFMPFLFFQMKDKKRLLWLGVVLCRRGKDECRSSKGWCG